MTTTDTRYCTWIENAAEPNVTLAGPILCRDEQRAGGVGRQLKVDYLERHPDLDDGAIRVYAEPAIDTNPDDLLAIPCLFKVAVRRRRAKAAGRPLNRAAREQAITTRPAYPCATRSGRRRQKDDDDAAVLRALADAPGGLAAITDRSGIGDRNRTRSALKRQIKRRKVALARKTYRLTWK